MWNVPRQNGLSLPLTVGLQNNDEINLGIEEFWSYFFPYDGVAEQFEKVLDKWVSGDARLLAVGWRGRVLQIREGNSWKTVYRMGWFFGRKVKAIIQNKPATQTPR